MFTVWEVRPFSDFIPLILVLLFAIDSYSIRYDIVLIMRLKYKVVLYMWFVYEIEIRDQQFVLLKIYTNVFCFVCSHLNTMCLYYKAHVKSEACKTKCYCKTCLKNFVYHGQMDGKKSPCTPSPDTDAVSETSSSPGAFPGRLRYNCGSKLAKDWEKN